MLGILYIVSTPIGNLSDISQRAVETLKAVDIVACEDTRRTGRLLEHLGIETKMLRYDDHLEAKRSSMIREMLQEGKSVAVVSDAGTPGIADPGFLAIKEAYSINASVRVIPGPVAFTSAALLSGLPTDAIFFGGFLPSKKGERTRRLSEVSDIPATLVFYESPARIGACLEDCLSVLGNRQAAVVREMTKIHEESTRGSLSELAETFSDDAAKGEMVIVIDRARQMDVPVTDAKRITGAYNELIDNGEDPKKALKLIAKQFGLKRAEAYRLLHIE